METIEVIDAGRGRGGIPSLSLAERQAFLRLPLEQRRRIMSEQAEELIQAYADHASERQSIQGGDIAF